MAAKMLLIFYDCPVSGIVTKVTPRLGARTILWANITSQS